LFGLHGLEYGPRLCLCSLTSILMVFSSLRPLPGISTWLTECRLFALPLVLVDHTNGYLAFIGYDVLRVSSRRLTAVLADCCIGRAVGILRDEYIVGVDSATETLPAAIRAW
jgi:hypothetical protein